MINFMDMVENTIADLFRNKVGRWNGSQTTCGKETPRKALLILFKIKKKRIQMLIHAPANYVGVYIREAHAADSVKGKFQCICYHDSCWTSDGIRKYLWDNGEDIRFCIFPPTTGWDIIETLTSSIHVVKLSETQLGELKKIRLGAETRV